MSFLYLKRVVFTFILGLSLFNTSHAKSLLLGLEISTCTVILDGEIKLNTLEDKQIINTFFSMLHLAIEQRNNKDFLSLFNFSGVTDTTRLELENFVQDFLSIEHSALSDLIMVNCLNKNRYQELETYGVSFTKDGQQIYTSAKGVLYRTNHPAFYSLDFQLTSETDENGDKLEKIYSIWLGPYDGKFMFTIGIPYATKID